ncbi:MAG: alpha/beta hydrolase [Chloroflexi bacterium]|nr:alpha/beta hydrolase [Chloroflexota bacterium]MYC47045.1 alpha/beta hydrolase [Chloroflexota bacterium]
MKGNSAVIWEVPKPSSLLQVQVEDGKSITLRRHGNPNGPRLIVSHGNGLAIDLYYPFWSLLAGDFDVLVHDLRNHGWNETGELEGHSVGAFARDQDRIASAISSHYGQKPTVGVFHSISALASLHTPSKGENYSALVLFDPPISNTASGTRKLETRSRETASMLRRRARWFRSREELADLHTYLPYFRRSVPGTLELLARTTLKESPTGKGFELRCPSQFEARIWDHASEYAASVDFGALRCPVKIVLPDATAQDLEDPVFDFRKADVCRQVLPETTHLLPLEKPHACTEAVRGFLKNLGIL